VGKLQKLQKSHTKLLLKIAELGKIVMSKIADIAKIDIEDLQKLPC